jgi:hypothetical protein
MYLPELYLVHIIVNDYALAKSNVSLTEIIFKQNFMRSPFQREHKNGEHRSLHFSASLFIPPFTTIMPPSPHQRPAPFIPAGRSAPGDGAEGRLQTGCWAEHQEGFESGYEIEREREQHTGRHWSP